MDKKRIRYKVYCHGKEHDVYADELKNDSAQQLILFYYEWKLVAQFPMAYTAIIVYG